MAGWLLHPNSPHAMTRPSEPVLFEALCTPPRGLGRKGLLILGTGMLLGAVAIGLLFLLLGAWPVLGFMGLEVAAVFALLAVQRRWSRRAMELVVLSEGRLTISRTDARGRRREVVMDPYWARLRLEERPGRVSALRLHQRQRAVEIGTMLGEEQKRDLAEALGAALRRYREPVFDNPQLLEC